MLFLLQQKTSRSIPVKENLKISCFFWHLQKIGYFSMFLIVAGALLGIFSNGILSRIHLFNTEKSFQIAYQYFARQGTQDQWEIKVKSNSQRPLQFQISDSLISAYAIEELQPQSIQIKQHRNILIFIVPQSKEDEWVTIRLRMRATQWGYFKVKIIDQFGTILTLKQWIYP
ncbi:TPA: hypothetical protein ACOZ3K_004200 [Yersinia enterocolitica]